MDIVLKIKEELGVEKWQVEAAIKLIDEGNTIPFISRYRKEVTGSLKAAESVEDLAVVSVPLSEIPQELAP